MTFQDLITEALNRLHDTSSDVTTRMRSWINLAYHDVTNRHDWPWLWRVITFRTTNAQAEYALSPEVEKVVDVRQTTTPIKLTELKWQDFDDVIPNPTDSGDPKYYLMHGIRGTSAMVGVTASTIGMVSSNTGDTTTVVVYGVLSGGEFTFEEFAITGTGTVVGAQLFSRVDRIVKASTSAGRISAWFRNSSTAATQSLAVIPPRLAAVEHPVIDLYPIPGTTATTIAYRYKKKVYDMANTAEVPEVPDQWHEVLVLGALVRGLHYMNHPLYPATLQEYEMMLQRMLKEQGPTLDYLPVLRSDLYPGPRPLVRIPRTAT